jgi:hypothetical protein
MIEPAAMMPAPITGMHRKQYREFPKKEKGIVFGATKNKNFPVCDQGLMVSFYQKIT